MKNQFLTKFINRSESNKVEIKSTDSEYSKLYGKRELINVSQATEMLNKSKQMNSTHLEEIRNRMFPRNVSGKLYRNSNTSTSLSHPKIFKEYNNSKLQNSLKLKGNYKEKSKLEIIKKDSLLDKKYQNDLLIDSRKRCSEQLTKIILSKSLKTTGPQAHYINKENLSEIEINQSQKLQKKLLEQASFQLEITGNFYSNYNNKGDYYIDNDFPKYDSGEIYKYEDEKEPVNSAYLHLFPEEKKSDLNKNLINTHILKSNKLTKLKSFDLVSPAMKGFISNKYKNLMTNYKVQNN